jgi:hypothetical protein
MDCGSWPISYSALLGFALVMGAAYGGLVALSPAVVAELLGCDRARRNAWRALQQFGDQLTRWTSLGRSLNRLDWQCNLAAVTRRRYGSAGLCRSDATRSVGAARAGAGRTQHLPFFLHQHIKRIMSYSALLCSGGQG